MDKQISFISMAIVLIIWINPSYTQPVPLYETVAENSDADGNLNELLEYLLAHPININSASREEMEQVPILNPAHIDLIIKHRPYNDKREFRYKIGSELYQLIHPYFTAKKTKGAFKFNFVQRVQYTLEEFDGFKRGIYLGLPFEAYSRLKLEYAVNFKAGLLTQKDIGERELDDHVSGFIQWQDRQHKSKLVLGDFQLRLGQGLVTSSPYSIGRSAYTIAPLRPTSADGTFYLSSNEYAGFRGVYYGYKIARLLSMAAFYSHKSQDALLDEQREDIVGINYSGYHRTISEVMSENILIERSYGGFIEFSVFGNNKAGVSAVRASYDPTIMPVNGKKNTRKDVFRFSGNIIDVHSFFYTINFSGLSVSGEIAANNWENAAHQHSLLISIRPWRAGIKWWRLPINYYSPFGRVFSNSSPFPSGEQGIYIALATKLNRKLGISSYWYSEKKLWRTYFNPMPTQSRDFFIGIDWNLAYQTNALFHFQSSDDQSYPTGMLEGIKERKYKLRLQIDKEVTENIRLRSRIEKVFINYTQILSDAQGINVYQDLFWRLKSGISFSVRFSSFTTTNYDARIYEYEKDLPGVFSTYPLAGKGFKWYIQYSWKIRDYFQIWLKYRQIYFDGLEAIGSGHSKIDGDSRQDLKFQIQFKH